MANSFSFRKTKYGRSGALKTSHGIFHTPAFMPIATRGAVKTIDARDLEISKAGIILSNTYHLYLRPGLEVLKKSGGLHRFMGWNKPILTDSGGYQVFSLSKFRKISEQGVEFTDTLGGAKHMLTPENVIDIQRVIGSDIMMVLDECPPYPSSKLYAKKSMALTTRWAFRALAYKKKIRLAKQKLFAIVQGSTYPDLRKAHAKELAQYPFDGFAIGGLAVGEPPEKMYAMIKAVTPYLPENKPRYLMGVGYPEQIVKAVSLGVDMFDCVLPTRNARHGTMYAFTSQNLKKNFYQIHRLKNSLFRFDQKPIDATCDCYTCRNHTRSYLHHLFRIDEPLAQRLATIHNVRFYLRLIELLRKR